MSIASALTVSGYPTAARPGPDLLALLAQGQVVDAKVLGQAANGATLVAIARQTMALMLAETLPKGTTLQLQMQGEGAARQLVVVSQTPPELPLPVPTPTPQQVAIPMLLSAADEAQPIQVAPASTEVLARLQLPNGANIDAKVLGQTASGTTRIVIGAQVLEVSLPEAMPAGTTMRLQVQTDGDDTRLALLPRVAAGQASSPSAVLKPVIVMPASTPVVARMQLPTGQVLAARVLTNLPIGESDISIGGETVRVTLPTRVAEGAPLRLVVQTGGAAPRLAMATSDTAPAMRATLGELGRTAIGRQDSFAPVVERLVGMNAVASALSAPVLKAGQQVLSMPLVLNDEAIGGETLQRAIAASGVFSESRQAQMPASSDIKSSLLQLRSALMAWLGADAGPPVPSPRRSTPPLKGGVPRSEGFVMPAGPDDVASVRDAGRALLGETDAALHRMHLLQQTALPDMAPVSNSAGTNAAQRTPLWTVEVPLQLGQELSMAQFQVSKDGGSGGQEASGERGWQMRFSVNYAVIGEVGAQIALRGRKVSVAIWAERDETAEVLARMLPELGPDLAARGIEAVSLHCRSGVPKDAMPLPAGQYVDAVK
ncbi:MAG TPA: flagellar hook-length control protein FliK [Devosiaceae bacterium]|jgi:hypothetical protein